MFLQQSLPPTASDVLYYATDNQRKIFLKCLSGKITYFIELYQLVYSEKKKVRDYSNLSPLLYYEAILS